MNVKLADYDNVLKLAQQLEPAEQLRLLETLAASVRYHLISPTSHSILELRGLGKEIWTNLDVTDYIEEERNSWNG